MTAIYGAEGIKAGYLQGASVDLLSAACEDLIGQGAELVIVPGFAEIALVVDAFAERGLPIFDANQVYARYAVAYRAARRSNRSKSASSAASTRRRPSIL